MRRCGLLVRASNATVAPPSLLTLKFVRQQRQGVRHVPPSETSTAVLLEERRCGAAGQAPVGSSSAAAVVEAAGATLGVAAPAGGVGGHAVVSEELRQLQRVVVDATAERVAVGPAIHPGWLAGERRRDDEAAAVEEDEEEEQQQPSDRQQQQGEQHQQRQRRQRRTGEEERPPRRRRRAAALSASGQASFAEWNVFCRLHASSLSLPHWIRAAEGLRSLVDSVRGPQQAQQAWEVAALLASRPLPPLTAPAVAHEAVRLVNLALGKGDYSILSALLALRPQPFSFGKRSLESLLRGALAADVEPSELQAVVRLAPAGRFGARAYFALVKSFEARGRVAEALQCYQQMQVHGLRRSPAMEAALKRLLDGRAASSRQSLASHR